MVVNHVVEHIDAGGGRRQIQHDLLVVSNELFQLSTSVWLQKHTEAPQEREHVQTLVSVVLGSPLTVISVRQKPVEQSARMTDCVQFAVLSPWCQVLLHKTQKSGKRAVKQRLKTALLITWTTLQPTLSTVHVCTHISN